MYRLALVSFAAIFVLPISSQSSVNKTPISPLRALYVQDQRDRGVALADNGKDMLSAEDAKKMQSFGWDEINKRDEERRKKVLEMFRQNQLVTAEDFHDASFIFQHGQTADDYLLAHILAMDAVVRGDTTSKWIAAATLDRYLQKIGQKQVFGTQYLDTQYAYYLQHHNDADVVAKMKAVPSQPTQQPYDENLLPALVRRDFCVPDLAEQKNYITLTTEGKPAEIPRISACPH